MMGEVRKELAMLARNLIKRMRLDLTSDVEEDGDGFLNGKEEQISKNRPETSRRWIAYPQTLRLTTRPRPPLDPDGTRSRTFNRISRSCSMPSMVFDLTNNVDDLAKKLVTETLVHLFCKLHPKRSSWNLSLVNVCATNISLVADSTKDGAGRDIKKMFLKQEDILKEWKVEDLDIAPSDSDTKIQQADHASAADDTITAMPCNDYCYGSEDFRISTQESHDENDAWNSEEDALDVGYACKICGAVMPPFATVAHERFHTMSD